MSKVLALLLAALLLLTGCGAPTKASRHTQADRLPDVTLASVSGGDSVDLGKLRGPAMVNVWASWCVPCKRELPIYAAFARKHSAAVRVLGIDYQEPKTTAALDLLKSSGVTYPVVADPDGLMHLMTLPKLVLVGADGKIAFQEYVEIKSLGQLEQLVEKHLGVTL